MTELSFLIELLLHHELPQETKFLLASRIKEVEQNLQAPKVITNFQPMTVASSQTVMGAPQAPSTLAALARHGGIPIPVPVSAEAPIPVEQVAQTIQTAQAMASRSTAIADAQKGIVDAKGGKRKW